MNEADTRYHLIDPILRDKGYVSCERITLETIMTPAPVEPSGAKGRRRKGPGRTDYLLCVQVGDMPKALPVAVLEAKKEADDPLKGMQQAKGYADCGRFDVKYVFSTNGHRYGEFDCISSLQGGPFPFANFPTHLDLTARYAKDISIFPPLKLNCMLINTFRTYLIFLKYQYVGNAALNLHIKNECFLTNANWRCYIENSKPVFKPI